MSYTIFIYDEMLDSYEYYSEPDSFDDTLEEARDLHSQGIKLKILNKTTGYELDFPKFIGNLGE